ncbi:hypothetical protein MKQ10_005076, partial [Escherichia coli]|nr:hypothetical protein [Escherichia coli]EIX5884165.1 hypothetical protein [Escherichia coli]
WDGDRLTTVQTDTTRIQTVGAPTGVACSVCPGGITYANYPSSGKDHGVP